MKKIIISFCLLLMMHFVYSQRWEHIYGNPGTNESPIDVLQGYDNGLIISSSYESPQSNRIFKTDNNGYILWEKYITWENKSVYPGYIKQDLNGNIIIASSISGFENTTWPLMIKLDSCGEKEWCRVFPKEGYEYGYYMDVLLLDNGDFLALGCFIKDYFDRIHLDYVDKDGNLIWRRAYAKKESYPLASAIGTSLFMYNNNYYIIGSCYYDYPGPPVNFYLTPIFIGVDSVFNEKWMLPFGVTDSLHGEADGLTKINDSLFLGAGWGYEGSDILSLLMIFDDEGNKLNYKKIQNETIGSEVKENVIKKIQKINDTLFMALASWGNENEYSGGEFILDTSANLHNIQLRPNTGGSREIIETIDSNFVIATGLIEGKTDWDVLMYKINENLESVPNDTNQYIYDSLCPHPISSGLIDISDCMIWVNTDEVPTPEEYYAKLQTIPIKSFPNPAKEKITFAFENTDKHKNISLECYNVFGLKVHEQKIYTGQLEAVADVGNWGKGLYFVVVKSNGKVVGKTKLEVE